MNVERKGNPLPGNDVNENDAFDAADRYLSLNSFEVKYINFPVEIARRQVRSKGRSQLRLCKEDAEIKLLVVFQDKTFEDIYKHRLRVRRLNTIPDNCMQFYTGFATLDAVKFCQEDNMLQNTVTIKANFDRLEECDESKDVYVLSRSNLEYNQFALFVEVLFYDGSVCRFTSRSFCVTGRSRTLRQRSQELEGTAESRLSIRKRNVPDTLDATSSTKSPRVLENIWEPN